MNRRVFLGLASGVGAGVVLSSFSLAADKPKKIVLLAGSPSHGPLEHEFNAGVALLAKSLKSVPNLEVVVVKDGWPKDEKILLDADAILLYSDGGPRHPFLRGKRAELIDKLMKKGVGLMCAHYAVEVPSDIGARPMHDWIGGYYEKMFSCNPMWSPEFKKLPEHPITRGVKPFSIRDEWYFNMRFRPEMKGVTPILSAVPSDQVRKGPYVYPKGPYPHIVKASGRPEVMMWAVERPDGGRGVGFTGGHFHRNWMDDNFRKVVLNALLWSAKIEVPAEGVASKVTESDLQQNLDPKKPRKK